MDIIGYGGSQGGFECIDGSKSVKEGKVASRQSSDAARIARSEFWYLISSELVSNTTRGMLRVLS
jgi:hypothetical protein